MLNMIVDAQIMQRERRRIGREYICCERAFEEGLGKCRIAVEGREGGDHALQVDIHPIAGEEPIIG